MKVANIIGKLSAEQCLLLNDNSKKLDLLNPQERKELRPVIRLYIPNRDDEWYLAAYHSELPMTFWGLANLGRSPVPLYQNADLIALAPFLAFDADFKPGKTLEEHYQEAVAYRMQSCCLNQEERGT